MRRIYALGALALLTLLPASASAFCGFYVASAEGRLFNEATMVVMMREGNTTVLSMQNDYRGPPEDFAMVIPVPVVLHEENVRTLPREVFERVDRLASPRLVEYWEQDPCSMLGEGTIGLGNLGTIGHGGGGGSGFGYGGGRVVVEAEFAVGEYDIVILGADDSGALEAWLRANHYRIPDGAEPVLRPYVEAGMKFFVARVDVDRVTFEDGHAVLSPLRFHYPSEEFSLPVRLGLLSSAGTQDLIVHILARDHRYELANYPNVVVPTNLDVQNDVRERFGEFYAALFDRTIERNPGAVVTEYAWQANGCDPCPGPVLSDRDLATLGADVARPSTGADPRSGGQVPTIRTASATVSGSMSRDVVRRIVRRHINEVRFCYEQALNAQPGLEGRVNAHWVITPTGAVESAEITSSTLGAPTVESCIASAVRRWTFPSSDDEQPVTVDYPFVLSSASFGGSMGGYGGLGGFGGGPNQSFVLTRLHYRYGRDELGRDLVFREAPPLVGGRENRDAEGALEPTSQLGLAVNNFQGRYAIRHEWTGPITCSDPRRGVWGGRPGGDAPEPMAATNLARAPRGRVELASMLMAPIAALGIDSVSPAAAQEPPAVAGGSNAEDDPPTQAPAEASPTSADGCGCRAARGHAGAGWAIAVLLAFAFAHRRRAFG